jgi:hypothetical protein
VTRLSALPDQKQEAGLAAVPHYPSCPLEPTLGTLSRRCHHVYHPSPRRGGPMWDAITRLVEGLARYVLEDALENHHEIPVAARCGFTVTDAPSIRRTTLLLLRSRLLCWVVLPAKRISWPRNAWWWALRGRPSDHRMWLAPRKQAATDVAARWKPRG